MPNERGGWFYIQPPPGEFVTSGEDIFLPNCDKETAVFRDGLDDAFSSDGESHAYPFRESRRFGDEAQPGRSVFRKRPQRRARERLHANQLRKMLNDSRREQCLKSSRDAKQQPALSCRKEDRPGRAAEVFDEFVGKSRVAGKIEREKRVTGVYRAAFRFFAGGLPGFGARPLDFDELRSVRGDFFLFMRGRFFRDEDPRAEFGARGVCRKRRPRVPR